MIGVYSTFNEALAQLEANAQDYGVTGNYKYYNTNNPNLYTECDTDLTLSPNSYFSSMNATKVSNGWKVYFGLTGNIE